MYVLRRGSTCVSEVDAGRGGRTRLATREGLRAVVFPLVEGFFFLTTSGRYQKPKGNAIRVQSNIGIKNFADAADTNRGGVQQRLSP